jgi:hypothetical protein
MLIRCGRIKGPGIFIVGSILVDSLLFLPFFAHAIVNAFVGVIVGLLRVVPSDYYGVRVCSRFRLRVHGGWVLRGW